MKRISFVLVTALAVSNLSFADEAAFNVKLADAKGKQAEARLIFSDDNKSLAAITIVASLRTGAIVMLTKSKSHWLYIDYHEQSIPKTVVLRMDKSDYKKIFEAVKTHTGKDEMKDVSKDKDKPASNPQ